jgi:hypothetical protein
MRMGFSSTGDGTPQQSYAMQREQSFLQQDQTYPTQQEQVYSTQQDQSYTTQQDQSYITQQDQSYTTQQDQSYSMQQNTQPISMSHTTSQQTITQPPSFLNTQTPHLFHTISASDDEMSETMSMADFELHPSHPNDHLSPTSLHVSPLKS